MILKSIITKYISRAIFGATCLALLVLGGLEFFILLVGQLNEIGHGNYGLISASLYVLSTLPLHVYHLFPLVALLGALLGLGTLAAHNELVVLRSSGLSLQQIVLIVLAVGCGLIFLISLMGELVGPRLAHRAEAKRGLALSGGQAMQTEQGTWVRNENRYIRIDTVAGSHLRGVTIYDFDSSNRLLAASYAESADYLSGHWRLNNVVKSVLDNNVITVQKSEMVDSELSLNPKMFGVESADPLSMDLLQLLRYTQYRAANGLHSASYALIFWQRVLQPLASIVMMLLAIPFIFGPLRESTTGMRIVVGVLVGFGFYMLNEFLGPASLLFQFPPFVSAALPSLLFAGVGLFQLKKRQA